MEEFGTAEQRFIFGRINKMKLKIKNLEDIPCMSFSTIEDKNGNIISYFIGKNYKYFEKNKLFLENHHLFKPRVLLRHEIAHYIQFKKGLLKPYGLSFYKIFLLELSANLSALKRETFWKKLIFSIDILEISYKSAKYYIRT
jgi:hypothetical protein